MRALPCSVLVVSLVTLAGAASGCGASASDQAASTGAAVTDPGVRAASLSWSDTCVVTRLGAVKCWGDNYDGELGNGTHADSYVPVDVAGLGADVAKVAVGGMFGCAVTVHGAAKCWGNNTNGQLGTGSTAEQTTPANVVGLGADVVDVAAGDDHACARMSDGKVKCWGANDLGQLGDGTTTSSAVPVDVRGIPAAVAELASAGSHTCARTVEYGLYCWGNNDRGQLGTGSADPSGTPKVVTGMAGGVRSVSVGLAHTCAVMNHDASVRCWGRNDFGQLGDGTTTDRNTPVAVAGLHDDVALLGSGGYHNCVVTNRGGAQCWGLGLSGQLGNGDSSQQASPPVDVKGFDTQVTAIALGLYHSCAITGAGALSCWGFNGNGDIGMDPSTEKSAVPVRQTVTP